MLIEKCFAKVYKSFEAIHGGTAFEAFFILTGAPYEIHDVNKKDR